MSVNPEKVRAGETIARPARGDTVVVLPACEDKTGGHWYCVTHEMDFEHQLAKDTHLGLSDNTCRLVWACHTHGPEEA